MMGVNRVNQAEEFMVEIKQFLTGDQTTVLTEEMKEILMEEMLNSVRIFQIAVPLLSNLALTSSLLLFPRPTQIFKNEYSQMREKRERYQEWKRTEHEVQLKEAQMIYSRRKVEEARVKRFAFVDSQQTGGSTLFNRLVSRKPIVPMSSRFSRTPNMNSVSSLAGGNRIIHKNISHVGNVSESDISQSMDEVDPHEQSNYTLFRPHARPQMSVRH